MTCDLTTKIVSELATIDAPIVGLQLPGSFEIFSNKVHQQKSRLPLPDLTPTNVLNFKPSDPNLLYNQTLPAREGGMFVLDSTGHSPIDLALRALPPHSVWTWATKLGFFNVVQSNNQRQYDVCVVHVCKTEDQHLAFAHLGELEDIQLVVRSNGHGSSNHLQLKTEIRFSGSRSSGEVPVVCSCDNAYAHFSNILDRIIGNLENSVAQIASRHFRSDNLGRLKPDAPFADDFEQQVLGDLMKAGFRDSSVASSEVRRLLRTSDPVFALKELNARVSDALVIDSIGEDLSAFVREDPRFARTLSPSPALISAMIPKKVGPNGNDSPASSEFDVNFDAFRREQPHLLEKHPDSYVAICMGKIIAVNKHCEILARKAWNAYPGRHVLIQPISKETVAFR
jgi:hypothetical protein